MRWNKENFGFCYSKIKDLEDNLACIYSPPPFEENIRSLQKVQADLDEWRLRVELVWRQKSREVWLQAGDKRRKNIIVALKDDAGNWVESHVEIGNYLTEKFTELYKEELVDFCDCLDAFINGGITDEDNARIDAPPTAGEIWSIVKSMHPIKAPRPDEMPALFFQNFWSTLGPDVIEMIQNTFRSALFLLDVNKTFIVLVPKIQ